MDHDGKCWHLTFASDGRLPLFAEEALRLRALHRLAAIAGQEAALFSIVDDHLHALLAGDRRRIARLGGSLFRALRPIADASLEPARIRPVQSRAHLQWLLRYLLTQCRHHGLQEHDALYSGSCFQDLVGARLVDGLDLQIRVLLPRFRLRDAYLAVGLPPRQLSPADAASVRAAGSARLAAAAAYAVAADPCLPGSQATVVRARRAAAQLGRQAGMPSGSLAEELRIALRSVQNYAATCPDDAAVRAVRMRLALENLVAAARVQRPVVPDPMTVDR
jgi:hypothetical protein